MSDFDAQDAHTDIGYGAQTDAESIEQMERSVKGRRDAQGYPRVGLLDVRSPVVATWPCWACKQPVEVTDAACFAFERVNRILARMNEPPFLSHQQVFCDGCGESWRKKRSERAERTATSLRQALARLRAGGQTPDQERQDQITVERLEPSEGKALIRAISEATNRGRGRRESV